MVGGLGKALVHGNVSVQVGACWHEWAHVSGASVQCVSHGGSLGGDGQKHKGPGGGRM